MKKQLIDRLVKRLDMSYELEPLLDSTEAYQRFERTITRILGERRGTKPTIRKKPIYISDFHAHCSLGAFDEALDCFKKTYGIGTSRETKDEIAESTGIMARCLSKIPYDHTHTPGKGVVQQKVKFVVDVLKQYHKKDIWYGTLGR